MAACKIEQVPAAIIKHKYTNTDTQIPIHKYQYTTTQKQINEHIHTNTQIQIQIHKCLVAVLGGRVKLVIGNKYTWTGCCERVSAFVVVHCYPQYLL